MTDRDTMSDDEVRKIYVKASVLGNRIMMIFRTDNTDFYTMILSLGLVGRTLINARARDKNHEKQMLKRFREMFDASWRIWEIAKRHNEP